MDAIMHNADDHDLDDRLRRLRPATACPLP